MQRGMVLTVEGLSWLDAPAAALKPVGSSPLRVPDATAAPPSCVTHDDQNLLEIQCCAQELDTMTCNINTADDAECASAHKTQ